jgi:hypothetical protein
MVGFVARQLAGFRGQAARCCVSPLAERQYALHLYGQGKTRALYDKHFFIARVMVWRVADTRYGTCNAVDIGVSQARNCAVESAKYQVRRVIGEGQH